MQKDHEEVWSAYTNGLHSSGDKGGAYSLIRKAIELFPDNAINYFIFAAINFRDGRRADGMEELEKGLSINSLDIDRFFSFFPVGFPFLAHFGQLCPEINVNGSNVFRGSK